MDTLITLKNIMRSRCRIPVARFPHSCCRPIVVPVGLTLLIMSLYVPSPNLPLSPFNNPACTQTLPPLPRQEVHHRQRTGGELRHHLLQRRLLRHVRVHAWRGHAEVLHLQLPVRRGHQEARHGPDGQGPAGGRGEEGGDVPLHQRW